MIKIYFTTKFKVHYKTRISKNNHLINEYREAVEIFRYDRMSSVIQDHQLEHKMYQYRAFSVNDDIRVVYLEKENHVLFVDIGTHAQVYRR